MTLEEINKKIIANNEKILSLVDPEHFIITKEVLSLLNENKKLQKQCKHSFNEKGICKYCFYIKKED